MKIIEHIERGLSEPNIHSHSNPDIDPSRTHLNKQYGLFPFPKVYYKDRLKELEKAYTERYKRKPRKDSVTLCSWVVQIPKDYIGDPERFWKATTEFFTNRYGYQNIISCALHLDENRPHMHIAFIPEQDGILKGKGIETPQSLSRIHNELERHIEARTGIRPRLITEELKDRENLSMNSYKAKKTIDNYKKSKEILEEAISNDKLIFVGEFVRDNYRDIFNKAIEEYNYYHNSDEIEV